MGSVTIGDIVLTAPKSWEFYDMGSMVLARPTSKSGALQISRAFRLDAGTDPSRDKICRLACQFAGVEMTSPLDDSWNTSTDTARAGGFRVRTETELSYYFYSWTALGLIVATFKTNSDDLVSVEKLANECKEIISSARFAS